MPISDEEHVSEQPVLGTLRPGPVIPGHTIQQDEEHFTWVIDQRLFPLSQPEYFCLKVLFEHVNNRVPFALLAGYLPEAGSSEDEKSERVRMRHLMSSLRSKIWMMGMDIVSLRDVGYMLLSEAQGETRAHHHEHAN